MFGQKRCMMMNGPRRLRRGLALLIFLVFGLAFTGCKGESTRPLLTTGRPTQTAPSLAPEKSSASSGPTVRATIKILPGAQLERDTIPALASVFGLEQTAVKGLLAAFPVGELVSDELEGVRRMEGLITAGSYPVLAGQSLADWLKLRVDETAKVLQDAADAAAAQGRANALTLRERLILASVVQAECLADTRYEEVSAVFLNRLAAGDKLQSCVTAEYQVGYQRPYLLYKEMDDEGPYNTYIVEGLPLGAIASPAPEALQAASRSSADPDLYFFFYDYLEKRLNIYADYESFREAGSRAYAHFEAEGPCAAEAVVNKQSLFGPLP